MADTNNVVTADDVRAGDLIRMVFDHPEKQYTTLTGRVVDREGFKFVRLGPGWLAGDGGVGVLHGNAMSITLLDRPAAPAQIIPEDAEYVAWNASGVTQYAQRTPRRDGWWLGRVTHGEYVNEEALLELIGDAEIVALQAVSS